VNALRPCADTGPGAVVRDDYTEDDITLDPLIVLRCDSRVFRFVASTICWFTEVTFYVVLRLFESWDVLWFKLTLFTA